MQAAEEAATLFAYADIRAQLERVLTLWPTIADAATLVGSDQAAIMLRAADAAAMTDDYGRAIALGVDVLLALDADADPTVGWPRSAGWPGTTGTLVTPSAPRRRWGAARMRSSGPRRGPASAIWWT